MEGADVKNLCGIILCLALLGLIHFGWPDKSQVETHIDNTTPIRIPSEEELLNNIAECPDNQIDVGLASLVIAKGIYPDLDVSKYLKKLDIMTKELKDLIGETKEPEKILDFLNHYINQFRAKGEGDYDIEGDFLNSVFDKAGNCFGYTTLYLTLGKRLDIPLYGVALKKHIFVRYDDGIYQRDIETTNGHDFSIERHIKSVEAAYGELLKKENIQYKKRAKKEIVGTLLYLRGFNKAAKSDNTGAMSDWEWAIKLNPSYKETLEPYFYGKDEK